MKGRISESRVHCSEPTHLDHAHCSPAARASPFPLDELAPDASNTKQPDALTLQPANLLLGAFDVSLVQVQVVR